MSQIFISHTEEDAEVALEIALSLEKAGYATWCYEIDSIPGLSYLIQTGQAIENARCVILIISPHSLGSRQVTSEVVRAHESGKDFIPIRRDITHIEFQNRQPEWREAVGAATSIGIPPRGVAGIHGRIIAGLKALEIQPMPSPDAARMDLIAVTLDELRSSITKTVTRPHPESPIDTPKVLPISIITPDSDQKTIINSIGMEFVLIPAGEFNMGSPTNEAGRDSDEGPVHRVKVPNAFYMGRYEVTQKQWCDVNGNNPSNFKGNNLPVEQVSWNDAEEFIKKLNEKEGTNKYRLPSEAEWEYAARAGTTTRYSFGDDESELGDHAWYDENSGSRPPKKGDYLGYDEEDWLNNKWNGKTHPVGEKKPNSWGLYDMHGNVWEWVQDIYHDNYSGPPTKILEGFPLLPYQRDIFSGAPTDGSAWEGDGSGRVLRGGGWDFGARNCRSANRGSSYPGSRNDDLGFRLLRIL